MSDVFKCIDCDGNVYYSPGDTVQEVICEHCQNVKTWRSEAKYRCAKCNRLYTSYIPRYSTDPVPIVLLEEQEE